MKLRKLNGIVIADNITRISGKPLLIFFQQRFSIDSSVEFNPQKREFSPTCTQHTCPNTEMLFVQCISCLMYYHGVPLGFFCILFNLSLKIDMD